MKLSIVIPLNNEELLVERNTEILLKNLKHTDSFEVILCNNGSSDNTFEKIRKIKEKYPAHIKIINTKERGIGKSLRRGFEQAVGDLVFWTGIDFPFGFSIINTSLDNFRKCDLLLNSKTHPHSVNKAKLNRKILSVVYQKILSLAFELKVKDPQGSLLLKNDTLKRLLPRCTSNSAFFQTQLIIYANLFGYRIREIPVKYTNPRKNSRFPILKEGFTMLRDLIAEIPKYLEIKRRTNKRSSNNLRRE